MSIALNIAKIADVKSKKTPPRMIDVVAIEEPHPEIKRVIFSGSELRGFPVDKNGAHIKLFFPRAHQTKPKLPKLGNNGLVWPEKFEKPITRTYSVRYYNAAENLLAVDFACNNELNNDITWGPAHLWLMQAKPGDQIGLAGPGGPDPLINPAEDQFFIVDTSALGALWALTEIPQNDRCHVFVVANHPVTLNICPAFIRRYAPDQYENLTQLYSDLHFDLMQHLNLQKHKQLYDAAAFVAGENSLVLGARNILIDHLKLTKKQLYAIPYWNKGLDEEAYHQRRHQIMDEAY